MRREKYIWKVCIVILCAVCLLQYTLVSVYASGAKIDFTQEGSLTVWFQTKENDFEGTKFQLYHVADISPATKFQLTESFRHTGISLGGLTEQQWKTLAQELTDYITKARTEIVPLEEMITDEEGKATFSDLPLGLYLVVGESCNRDNEVYTPIPFLVSLPNRGQETVWEYEVDAVVKYTFHKPSEPGKQPETGDAELIGVLFLAIGSVCGMFSLLKKR